MDWVSCSECIYFDECEDRESRDGCYCGDTRDDTEHELKGSTIADGGSK